MNVSELAALFNQDIHSNETITMLEVDSRLIKLGGVFVACSGKKDGHDYIIDAENNGAVAALVLRKVSDVSIPQIVVNDINEALFRVAHEIRSRSNAKVIGVTGSYGKTTLKDLLAHMLSFYGKTLSTSGNFNNELGVPLTLSYLLKPYNFAVVEMGACRIGDIEYLTQMANPDMGLITCAREVHLDSFLNIDNVIKGKGELFTAMNPGTIFFPSNDTGSKEWMEMSSQHKVQCFSDKEPFAIKILGYQNKHMRISIDHNDHQHELLTSLLGSHQLKNINACLKVIVSLGLDVELAIKSIASFNQKNRQIIHNISSGLLIDDTYNASPDTVKSAMTTLVDLNQGDPIFILGSMAELSSKADQYHYEVAKHASDLGINLYYCGQYAKSIEAGYGHGVNVYSDVDEFIKNDLFHKSGAIWVKGSRSAGMERIVDYLLKRDVS